MKPFTYYLYHKPTGKKYYGVRTARGCDPKDLWTTYFSSSREVKTLREQYGDDSFEWKIRKTFNSAQEALEWEERFLTRIDAAARNDWINKHNGGKNFSHANKTHTEESRRKISLAGMGRPGPRKGVVVSDETRKKLSESRTGSKHFYYGKHLTEEHRKKISQSKTGKAGTCRTQQTRKKISESKKGKKHTEETRKKMKANHSKPWLGKKLSDEHRRRISEARRKSMNNGAGKGDPPRPFSVDRRTYHANWERSFGNHTESDVSDNICAYSGLTTASSYESDVEIQTALDRLARQKELKEKIDSLEEQL